VLKVVEHLYLQASIISNLMIGIEASSSTVPVSSDATGLDLQNQVIRQKVSHIHINRQLFSHILHFSAQDI
jgi:hypothetical protein